MEEKLDARPHKLELLNREKGSVTGIQDVVSFDENQICLLYTSPSPRDCS